MKRSSGGWRPPTPTERRASRTTPRARRLDGPSPGFSRVKPSRCDPAARPQKVRGARLVWIGATAVLIVAAIVLSVVYLGARATPSQVAVTAGPLTTAAAAEAAPTSTELASGADGPVTRRPPLTATSPSGTRQRRLSRPRPNTSRSSPSPPLPASPPGSRFLYPDLKRSLASCNWSGKSPRQTSSIPFPPNSAPRTRSSEKRKAWASCALRKGPITNFKLTSLAGSMWSGYGELLGGCSLLPLWESVPAVWVHFRPRSNWRWPA